MFASYVRNVSSFWPTGPHDGEQMCWFNASQPYAKRLPESCGYPYWHPLQILGPPRPDKKYGSSFHAWSPGSTDGRGSFATGGDGYLQFAHNPSASYDADHYTEFIELGFDTVPVYIQEIEVGENRGVGTILQIEAKDPSGEYAVLWQSPIRQGDPVLEWVAKSYQEYREFGPLDLCQTTFKTDHIRLKLDTRSVPDWNELDYVRLIGAHSLPEGVFSSPEELSYRPNPNENGDDYLEYTMTDCAFQRKREAEVARVNLHIMPANDPPFAASLSISEVSETEGIQRDFDRQGGLAVNLTTLISDVDDAISILVVTLERVLGRVDATIKDGVLLVHWAEHAGPLMDAFEVQYTVTDSHTLSSTGTIVYRPSCAAGTLNFASVVQSCSHRS